MSTETDLCFCDHYQDDHGLIGECLIPGCECIHFDAADDDEWDGDEDRE